jgi:hypothetical protein
MISKRWAAKLEATRRRDEVTVAEFTSAAWLPLVVWEPRTLAGLQGEWPSQNAAESLTDEEQ